MLGVVLASMPAWLPWAMGPVLHHYGVRYESYERMGYSRLTLSRVQIQAGEVHVGTPAQYFSIKRENIYLFVRIS